MNRIYKDGEEPGRIENHDAKALYTAQCASREKASTMIRNKAQQLYREAEKLEELAKNLDILPDSIEAVIYPFIAQMIYGRQ